MEITGTLKVKNDTQVVSDKFKKREFVLTTEASTPYHQHVTFQCTQDKCDLLDKYSVGHELTVSFNLRGREWNGPQGIKYFNTLEAWLIRSAEQSNKPAPNVQAENHAIINNNLDNYDLPF